MERRIDLEVNRLIMSLFDDFTRGYKSLGEFRGRISTEIQRSAPGPLKPGLEEIDRLVSGAQDDLDKAVEEMRKLAPGTLLVTLGRKPHHLPGR